MKILIVTPTLGYGGAERVISMISNELKRRGHGIDVLVLNGTAKQAYVCDGVIKWQFTNVRRGVPKLFKFLHESNYDLVFSSARNINYYLAIARKLGLIKKLVLRDNSVISALNGFISIRNRLFINVFSFTYRWADAIVCQSSDMLKDVHMTIGVPESKLFLIHNPANSKWGLGNAERVPRRLISVGRLSREKGYDRLLESLSKIREEEWTCLIYGSGPEEASIKRLASALFIHDKVRFVGTSNDISIELQSADLFVTGSYVEGFPNSVLEAIICGLPVVAFDAPGGTKEIIEQGFNGFLAKDVEQFSRCLLDSFEKWWPRREMSELAKQKFSEESIFNQYEQLFLNVVNA